jgi:hypothetical protein
MKRDLFRKGNQLFWLNPPKNHPKSRDCLAGYLNPDGYVVINIDKKCWCAHRVVWLLEYGYWPKQQIDHIDGNKSNNAPSNLREVTQQQNSTSYRKTSSGVTSEYRGVSFNSRSSKWVSNLTYKGKRFYLGRYTDEKDAALAFNKKAMALGFNKESLNVL